MNLVYLILGWLLGMLSPLIVADLQQKRQTKKFMASILLELEDLRFRMALVAYNQLSKVDQVDRAFMKWFFDIIDSYRGPDKEADDLPGFDSLRKLTDAELKVLHHMTSAPGRTARVAREGMPLLDGRLEALATCSIDFQQKVLNIRTQLGFYNNQVDDIDASHAQTFDTSLSVVTREIVQKNLEQAYGGVGRRAQQVGTKISKVLDAFAAYRKNQAAS